MMTPEQIKHIEEHQKEFDEFLVQEVGQPGYRTVQEYSREYSSIEDLYYYLCNDLGIDPQHRMGM